jgi:hypothetical protein
MTQLFHRSFNALSRASIFGAAFFAAGGLWLVGALNRSPYVTGEGVAVDQPVPFSHAHHVGGLGLDCRYCHTSVELGASAGLPSTKTCMTCHSMVWKDTPTLELVRASWRDDESLPWVRVHDLPDFAYFDHSIHVAKGVGCAECHGRVDRMPLIWREHSLNMEWCLGCHRDPGPHLRPRERVFDLAWSPGQAGLARGELADQLVRENQVAPSTDCSTCHR